MQLILDRLKAPEDKQKPTVASLKKGTVVQFSLGKAADFDKYKVLDMVQDLKNVAINVEDKNADHFSAVFSTLAEKIDKPEEQFKSYVLTLLGDRDYEKMVEARSKSIRILLRMPLLPPLAY